MLSGRRLSALCVLLVAMTIVVGFACVSLAQSGSDSQNASRPRRNEDVPRPRLLHRRRKKMSRWLRMK